MNPLTMNTGIKRLCDGETLERGDDNGNHKEFLAEILDRLSGLDGVTHRAMMGSYILYYNGKIIGGIYDNRLLVKTGQSCDKLPAGCAV